MMLTYSSPELYTFNATTNDYENRFKLMFSANNDCDDVSTSSAAFAFVSNGNIIINGTGILQVIDITGRIIVSTDVACNVTTSGMTPEVYVLRLINGDEIKTQKIVVR